MLTVAITSEGFELISRRDAQIIERFRGIELDKAFQGDSGYCRKPAGLLRLPKITRRFIGKRPNHCLP